MKIRTKLVLMYLLGAFLTSVTSFFAINSYQSIKNDFDVVMNDPVKKIKAIKMIVRAGLRIVDSTSEISLLEAEKKALKYEQDKSPQEIDNLEFEARKSLENEEKEILIEGRNKYLEGLQTYKNLVNKSADKDKDFVKEIELAGNNLLASSEQLIELKKREVFGKEVLDKKEVFENKEQEFVSAIEQALKVQDAKLATEQEKVSDTITQSSRNTLIATTLAFLLAISSGFAISRSITNPISQLQQASRRIGRGDLDTPILIKSRDEIGKLANDFQKMALHLKTSRNEILKSRDFVENLIGSMADMLISIDDKGFIQRVNQSTLNLLGYEEGEIVGKPVDILTQKETFLTETEFNQMLKMGKLIEVEKDFVCKNGSKFRASISASILQGQSATASVVVAKDISKRIEDERKIKKYARELEQSNRELEDFAYVASHDLQEPLRKVQAFGDRLSRKYSESLNEEANDYIRRMREAANRMQSLINDLLTFSRVSSKGKPFQQVDIKQITEEVVSDLELRIEQTKGTVKIGNLPKIDADPVQMRQLMQNLIGNSLKFHRSDKPPLIKIYSEHSSIADGSFIIDGKEFKTGGNGSNFCQIVVQDNGIGFEEKYLSKIFTVFQRLHGRLEYEGSGIGLAVCRKIVERHGGTITAKSKPGEGAAFLISLPITQINKEITTNDPQL